MKTTLLCYSYFALVFFITGCKNKPETDHLAHSDLQATRYQEEKLSDSLLSYVKYHTEIMALTNATIIDGTGNSIKENQTLVINNGYFRAIGPDAEIDIPRGATVINLVGKTIIPGIIGMHNHLHIPGFPFVGNVASKLYLASGVTTIQTCGAASPEQEIALAKQIVLGYRIGPDIITSAPFITGEGGNPNMVIPRSEQHIRDTMQHWIKQGVKWFKVYRNTDPDDLKIILDEAHKNNGKVRGHLCSIAFEEATRLGIDGIEHGLNSTSDFRTGKDPGVCNGGREYMDELIINSPKVRKLQQLMIDNHVFLTSTMSIYEASVPNRAYADERTIKAMSLYLVDQYRNRRKNFDRKINDLTREKRLKKIMQFEYQFYKMGGLLCSGADAGRHVLPGYGDQRNYQLFTEAGFSTEEAVQIITGNGARALERTDIGAVQAGKRADFVILNGNLEKDAAVIEKVETVFKKGIGYDPEKILGQINGKFGTD
ncbi:amidohydrolase family protein [Sinomicrobium sp. M5D2P9]